MERRTQFVGDCIPGLLKTMMMIVLEMRVITVRSGMINPKRGYTYCRGPRFVDMSMV